MHVASYKSLFLITVGLYAIQLCMFKASRDLQQFEKANVSLKGNIAYPSR